MKVRHYLAVALATLILHGVTWASCQRPRQCDPLTLVTCEPQ